MIEMLPIDLIVEIGILAGPDEYEQIAKISERNAIILRKPYITRATNVLIVSKIEMTYKGRLHSFGDQPASITETGTYWYRYGKLHRDNDQPAAIRANGDKYWYQHGNHHRDNDQPATEYAELAHCKLNRSTISLCRPANPVYLGGCACACACVSNYAIFSIYFFQSLTVRPPVYS
jgi:hypothetical protein